MATIHPYKGYLNTEYRFYATGTESILYSVFSDNSESSSPVLSGVITPTIPHSIKIKVPGEYKVVFSDGTSSIIIVEDAYKFGGSAYKKSFIFDETPWCFVIMNDRTYFYNRETDESYVESISPDTIHLISTDYILLENYGQDEKTIYSLIGQCPMLNVTNIVYYNNEVLIWEEKSNENINPLVIYSLQEKRILKAIHVEKFIFDEEANSLIFIIENTLHKQQLDLPLKDKQTFRTCGQLISLVSPNIAISVEKYISSSKICIFDTRKKETISRLITDNAIVAINSEVLIDINKQIESLKAFDLSQIGCERAKIKASFTTFSFYPTKWDVYCILEERIFEHGIRSTQDSTIYKVKSLLKGSEYSLDNSINKVVVTDKNICFANYKESIIFGLNISPEYSRDVNIFIHNQDVIRSFNGNNENISILDDNIGWKSLGDSSYSLAYFNEFGIFKNEDNNTFFNLHGDTLSGYACIITKPVRHLNIGTEKVFPNGDVLPNFNTHFSKSRKYGITKKEDGIFLMKLEGKNVIRKNIISDIYDTSSYKSVLLSEDGSKIMYRDEKETIILDVTSNNTEQFDNVSYVKDVNGIRPLFSHRAGSLQPRIVNPVTGQLLPHTRMGAYQFVSPDGLFYADTKIEDYEETWSIIDERQLSISEITQYNKRFNYVIGSNEEDDKLKELDRKTFIKQNFAIFKKALIGKGWTERKDEEWVGALCNMQYDEFSRLFLKKKGIAYIRRKKDDSIVAKIELGDPLWFLNYVSFSYDSRYVAIAGRYPNSSRFGGLFLVYDIINKKEIISERNSWAVWMTAFNQNNQVMAYSGEPISYSCFLNDENFTVYSCPGFNFLTFSPDGKYAAFSNQGYVSKYDSNGNVRKAWGHQPSTDVYVAETVKLKPIIKFSDLSNSGIDGLSDKNRNYPKTVTSVSFSNENKKLMMVGNDGVVIIRNLHLEDYACE